MSYCLGTSPAYPSPAGWRHRRPSQRESELILAVPHPTPQTPVAGSNESRGTSKRIDTSRHTRIPKRQVQDISKMGMGKPDFYVCIAAAATSLGQAICIEVSTALCSTLPPSSATRQSVAWYSSPYPRPHIRLGGRYLDTYRLHSADRSHTGIATPRIILRCQHGRARTLTLGEPASTKSDTIEPTEKRHRLSV
jgi:hypothetical protein